MDASELARAFHGLSARHQRVLWHWAVLGEAEGTVAAQTGIPEGAVAHEVDRARVELGVRVREVRHRRPLRGVDAG